MEQLLKGIPHPQDREGQVGSLDKGTTTNDRTIHQYIFNRFSNWLWFAYWKWWNLYAI